MLEYSNTKDAGSNLSVLVYGRTGVGKTRMIGTAQKPIIISSENKLLSIKEYNFPVLKVADLDDVEDALVYVEENIDKFKTVCLDSLTDIANAALLPLLKEHKDIRRAYGLLQTGIARILRRFIHLPIQTYVICQAEDYESASGLTAMRPSMPGKTLTNNVPFMFDEVLALLLVDEGGDTVNYLQTKASMTVEANDSGGTLKEKEPPNLKKLFKKLK